MKKTGPRTATPEGLREILARVDQWAAANNCTRSEAVAALLQRGLDAAASCQAAPAGESGRERMKPVYASENFDATRTAALALQIEDMMMPAITAETETEIEIRTDEALCALIAVLARLFIQFKNIETDPAQPDEIVSQTAVALNRQLRREIARRAGGGYTRQ